MTNPATRCRHDVDIYDCDRVCAACGHLCPEHMHYLDSETEVCQFPDCACAGWMIEAREEISTNNEEIPEPITREELLRNRRNEPLPPYLCCPRCDSTDRIDVTTFEDTGRRFICGNCQFEYLAYFDAGIGQSIAQAMQAGAQLPFRPEGENRSRERIERMRQRHEPVRQRHAARRKAASVVKPSTRTVILPDDAD
jgi:hypothetical protein